jgi:uncharacterized membrane protein
MTTTRVEAFSDAVIAIIITIMVIELKAPHGAQWSSLKPLAPVFFTYIISFFYLGIYWNNHHHMLHIAKSVNGKILWANLHLLFWLSLIPFVTGWMGESDFAPVPTVAYGADLLFAAIAYYILERTIMAHEGRDSKLKAAVGREIKGIVSVVFYVLALPLAFINCWISLVIYLSVALWWLVPDKRIEKLK